MFSVADSKKALNFASKVEGLRHYSARALRRFFCTTALRLGVDPTTVGHWQGHPDGTLMVYPVLWFFIALSAHYVLPPFGLQYARFEIWAKWIAFAICALIFVLHALFIRATRRCDIRLGAGESGVGARSRRKRLAMRVSSSPRKLGFIKPPWFGDERTFTALTLTIVNCGCLWWWTWVQFLIGFMYGFPVVGAGFGATPMALGQYLPIPGLGLTVPQLFLTITVVGVAIPAPAAWFFTKGASGRFRMLGLLAISAAVALGFSTSVVRWRALHIRLAKSEAEWLRNSESAKR